MENFQQMRWRFFESWKIRPGLSTEIKQEQLHRALAKIFKNYSLNTKKLINIRK